MAMFLVLLRRAGPEWDRSKPMEEQSGWDEHASFMDGLVDAGFLVRRPALRRRPCRPCGRGRVGSGHSRHIRARSVERDTPRDRLDRALDDPARLAPAVDPAGSEPERLVAVEELDVETGVAEDPPGRRREHLSPRQDGA